MVSLSLSHRLFCYLALAHDLSPVCASLFRRNKQIVTVRGSAAFFRCLPPELDIIEGEMT